MFSNFTIRTKYARNEENHDSRNTSLFYKRDNKLLKKAILVMQRLGLSITILVLVGLFAFPLISLPQLASQTASTSTLGFAEGIDPEGAIIFYLTSPKRRSLDGAFTGFSNTYSVPSENAQVSIALRTLNGWHYIPQEQVESYLEYVKSTYREDIGVFTVVPYDPWYDTGTVLEGVGSLGGADLMDVEWFDKNKLISWLASMQDLNASSLGYGLFKGTDLMDDEFGGISSTLDVLLVSKMLGLNISATFDYQALQYGLNSSLHVQMEKIEKNKASTYGISLTTTSMFLANLTSLITADQKQQIITYLQNLLVDEGVFPNHEGPPYPHEYNETIADMPGQYYGLRVVRDLDAWDRFNLTPIIEFIWTAQDLETLEEEYWGGFSLYPRGSKYDMSEVLGRRDMATYPTLGNTYFAVVCLDMLGLLNKTGERAQPPEFTTPSSPSSTNTIPVSFAHAFDLLLLLLAPLAQLAKRSKKNRAK